MPEPMTASTGRIGGAAGDQMAGPSWNRSRVAAVLATLLLHWVVGFWLLQTWTVVRVEKAIEEHLVWLPLPLPEVAPDLPPPLEDGLPPLRVAPISAPPLPMPLPEVAPSRRPDWSSTAREVAKGMTTAPTYQRSARRPRVHRNDPRTRIRLPSSMRTCPVSGPPLRPPRGRRSSGFRTTATSRSPRAA